MENTVEWKVFYEKMKQKAPLTIEYPICGGAEECITACPMGREIWEMKPMKVSFLGIGKRIRLRPFMIHPELCKRCNICIEACPTGALKLKENPVKSRFISILYNSLKVPFKKKYNLKFITTEEHKNAFKHNNSKQLK
ncbi:4Fe-4S dicluster domain-containing protein [Athalassotoga saccharophila]|uniref:NAD(P)H-quinone oxidoreductase subunit I, chloroplastic n=1 Tax=Athalassotoga saccharophila TaxID=1441386 RepID=A0A6N4TF17_9BACT|nr:ferredoxin family protein [Athalassotoga saccharophila]BBJ29074.1 NAD(P)H-quinone oxidoreductase subunit I, chloroplastic [Athalassotoga saccharophila]